VTVSRPDRRTRVADSHAVRSAMTDVELIWIAQRLEHRIRFGRIAGERIVTPRTRIVSFLPGAIFAFTRWSSNDYGTVHSRIDILRATSPGEAYTTAPFVRPGGELLLSLLGSAKVAATLAAIEAIEGAGVDPCEVAPDHWRHLHNRISAGEAARPYTAERHAAWLKRKALDL